MRATDVLKDEHKEIKRMIKILKSAADKLESGKRVHSEIFEKAVEFTRMFSDKCHHGKEEDTLFKLLEERGFPRESGPIGVMLKEHEIGRSYVRGLGAATERYKGGDKNAAAEIIKNARGYAELLAQHIDKEDSVLYPMADRVLTSEDDEELLKRFETVEEKQIGEETHRRLIRSIDELEKKMREI